MGRGCPEQRPWVGVTISRRELTTSTVRRCRRRRAAGRPGMGARRAGLDRRQPGRHRDLGGRRLRDPCPPRPRPLAPGAGRRTALGLPLRRQQSGSRSAPTSSPHWDRGSRRDRCAGRTHRGRRWPAAWDRADIELITHDAHAPGHTALWLPDCRVLIAGDMLSDVELPLLEESTVADYDNGLNALRPYAVLARVVCPGTGVQRSAGRRPGRGGLPISDMSMP